MRLTVPPLFTIPALYRFHDCVKFVHNLDPLVFCEDFNFFHLA
jgi:hypothetical protein